jgi:thiol-disulfide isomerase/thioredoxin
VTPALRLLLTLCLLAPVGAGARDAAAGTDLQPVSFAEWDAVLESQHGAIVVVDYWASWCPPCIERFPHMVEMHHEYGGLGVQFISLNLDEEGDTEALEWCNDFLARVQAEFLNYHLEENMSAAFERLDLLGLPVVRVFTPDGGEAYKLTGDNPHKQFTEQDVENAILELLAR